MDSLYWTSKWHPQVASWIFERKISSYTIKWTREKTKLVLWRNKRIRLPAVLEKSGKVSLFNRVWNISFAQLNPNKKTIRDRGWYPVNKKLITNPEILKRKLQTLLVM